MTSNVASAREHPSSFSYSGLRDESAWLSWLREHTEFAWRPGQWNPELWLFTCSPDDPTTVAATCVIVNCSATILHGKMCQTCAKAWKQSNLDLEEFIRAHRRPNPRRTAAQSSEPPRCAVGAPNGLRCPSKSATRDLCETHYRQWNIYRRRHQDITLEEWTASGQVAIPDAALPDCLVPACNRESMTPATKICRLHNDRYARGRFTQPIDVWAVNQLPHIGAHQFILLQLPERLRWEVLYAIQQRDRRGGRIDPESIKAAIRIMEASPSLAVLSKPDIDRLAKTLRATSAGVHLHQFGQALRNAYNASRGRTAKDALIWDLDDVGFRPEAPGQRPRPRRRKSLDFSLIGQPWLRQLILTWAREEEDSKLIVKTHRAAAIASQALEQRADRGRHLSQLGNRDVDAIAERFRLLTRVDNGAACQASFKRNVFAAFFELISWGRRHGHLDDLPPSFEPTRSTVHLPADPVVEKAGRAIPVAVQRQLDACTDSLGRGFSYGSLTHEQSHQMFLTAYIVLRDTGRRTLEVASLRADCLTRDAAGPVLIYDNHKARRMGRRLPILQSTADMITEWASIRKTIATSSQEYLFPGTRTVEKHLSSSGLSAAIRKWVRGLERLDSDEIGSDGSPIPFDRSAIYPYAFRHSYAQRHADNGTPVDVLRQLMDHRSIQTTGGYYDITAQRKRSAIETVGKLAMDKDGTPAPMNSPIAYQMRSVAVPFGNCTEPSNVKAGGKACPIRFQCAGCGFYRPDPSFMPAIEEHINALRADREIATAMNSAPFVVANLDAQIDAFCNVLKLMRDALDGLDSEQRRQVEDASTVLRRARAGARLPLADITARKETR